jgi:hypothetical protein
MQPPKLLGAGESSAGSRASNPEPTCPCCAGSFGERGRMLHCLRCGFAICPGCEGPSPAPIEDHEYPDPEDHFGVAALDEPVRHAKPAADAFLEPDLSPIRNVR